MKNHQHRPSRLARTAWALIVVFAGALAPRTVEATQVRAINLEQMTERADRIFAGHCLDVREVQDEALGLMVLIATFRVDRTVKGHLDGTVTVKVLSRSAALGLPGGAPPDFRAGEDVVLFLYGNSNLGLTSAVGAGQGMFSVIEDKRGRKLVLNPFGNRNLTQGLSAESLALSGSVGPAAVPLEVSPDALLDWAAGIEERAQRRVAAAGAR